MIRKPFKMVWVLTATVALVWPLCSGIPLAAAERDNLPDSIRLVPQDAAFYGAMLRMREQVEIIAQSKAWSRLKAMPSVQEALKRYREAAERGESLPARLEQARKNPQTAAALATLADMLSNELFIYAGSGWVDVLDLLEDFNATMQYRQMSADLGGPGGEQAAARAVIDVLIKHLDALRVPTLMVGFKVEDTQRAQEQLDALAGLAGLAVAAVPQLSQRLTRTKVDGHPFVVLTLDGSMIPWEEAPVEPLREVEGREGDVEKVIDRLKASKLTVAIGLRDNYLLFCLAESTDAISQLGQGEVLVDRPELEPLRQHAGKRITSVGYMSEALARKLGSVDRDIDNLVRLAESLLQTSTLSKEEQAEILRDVEALGEDIKSLVPVPGAVVDFSYLTRRGVEGYRYNHGQSPYLDGSQPLDLLSHVGGNPVLAAVWREKYQPEIYDQLVEWLRVGYKYFEKYAVPEMDPHEREQYQRFADRVWPLLKRAHRVTREMFIPSMRDSQGGVVVDGKLAIRRICRGVPAFDKPMPMVEVGLVLGLSDADQFVEACGEYREIFNSVVEVLHEMAPEDIPHFAIPEPIVRETAEGTLYLFPLPADWGVDRKIVPNLGVGEHVAVVTFSRQHSQRLLRETPLRAGGVLADAQRPRAVGAVFDWAGLVEAATPWVERVARQMIEKKMNLDPDSAEGTAVMDQVHTVLDVLKTIRRCTFESYFENGVLVTHSLMEVRDVE